MARDSEEIRCGESYFISNTDVELKTQQKDTKVKSKKKQLSLLYEKLIHSFIHLSNKYYSMWSSVRSQLDSNGERNRYDSFPYERVRVAR